MFGKDLPEIWKISDIYQSLKDIYQMEIVSHSYTFMQ